MTRDGDRTERDDEDDDALVVDLGVFEGPLDLLLELVRSRKLDIGKISILSVVDQFLEWMQRARAFRLELAADWLLMAATLAAIKSRLLLPSAKEDREDAEAAMERLNDQLRRLDAIRSVAEELGSRRRLGVHWHTPGENAPEKGRAKRLEATLHALLSAYAREARRTLAPPPVPVRKPFLVFSVEEAIRHLLAAGLIDADWRPLDALVPKTPAHDATHARSQIASSYVASLELAKRGQIEVRQLPDGAMVEIRSATGAAS